MTEKTEKNAGAGETRKVQRKAGGSGAKLYRNVIDTIKAEIEAGAFPLGSRLPSEKALVERFSVSRLTVREALIGLEILGMVEGRQGAGVFVRQTSLSGTHAAVQMDALDIGPVELIEARLIVEVQAAALAALEASDEQVQQLREILADMEQENLGEPVAEWAADRNFHLLIAQASQNRVIAAIVENLWEMRRRSPLCHEMLERISAAGQKPRLNDHRIVFDAIEMQDPVAARQAMQAHLDRVMDDLLTFTEMDAIEKVSSENARRREKARQRLKL